MMNFFKGIKDRLSKDDAQPVYRQYTHGQLKIIAMRTRMIFQDLYKKQSTKITLADNQFKKVQASQGTIHDQYEVLQQISKKVIQTEMIKLYIQILKKIQAYAPQIINTKGDVAFMKQEIKWFQCILWYKKCKKLHTIDEMDKFCWNFFKGVDITMELNLKCELFQVYEGLQYLDDDFVVPLDLAVQKIVPFVSFQIGQEDLDEMKRINGEEIRQKEEEEKRKSIEQNPFINFPNRPIGNEVPINTVPYDMNKNTSNAVKVEEKKDQPQQPNNPIISNPYIYHSEPQHKSNKDYAQVLSQDQQFALDPYSRVHKPTTNSNKTFKSNDLNLIEWQSAYTKKQPSQQNPYINNSQISLINHDYSLSSEQNSYDQTTLPYPPSGVISVEDIGKKDQFYIDSLPMYEPNPLESHIGFAKKPQINGKLKDDSFLKSIENQYFSHQDNHHDAITSQNQINTFNEQDLLSQGSKKKPVENSGGKSLNKLFGFKFKSNLNPIPTTQPVPTPFGTNSQNYGQNNSIQSSESNKNQIDDLLNNLTLQTTQKSQYKIKSSDIDDILQELNNNPTQSHHTNPVPNRFSVDQMLRDLTSNNNNNPSNAQKSKDSQHLDEDIQSLIESHKQQIKKQSSSKDFSEGEYKKAQKQAENEETEFTPYYYADDNQRFNDSKIKFSEQMQLLDEFQCGIKQDHPKQSLGSSNNNQTNPQLPQQLVQETYKTQSQNSQIHYYNSLQKDLYDSLKIIKNHYGQQIPQNRHQTKTLIEQPSPKIKNTIKKPYMASIYARNQYIDGLKLNKHQSCQ